MALIQAETVFLGLLLTSFSAMANCNLALQKAKVAESVAYANRNEIRQMMDQFFQKAQRRSKELLADMERNPKSDDLYQKAASLADSMANSLGPMIETWEDLADFDSGMVDSMDDVDTYCTGMIDQSWLDKKRAAVQAVRDSTVNQVKIMKKTRDNLLRDKNDPARMLKRLKAVSGDPFAY